jgi:hypothetical protein
MSNNLLEQARSLAIAAQCKAQQEELARRLQAHLAHPERVMTLDEVTAAVINSLRR